MTIDTEYTTFPVCPKCGQSDYNWWDRSDVSGLGDGDVFYYDCPFCSEPVGVAIHIIVKFSTWLTEK
jgi:hypothetical protein